MSELSLFNNVDIELNGVKHELKYTLASWVGLEKCGITAQNLNDKMSTETISTLSYMLYYGLPKHVRSSVSFDDFTEDMSMEQLTEITTKMNSAVEQSMPEVKEELKEAMAEIPLETEVKKK